MSVGKLRHRVTIQGLIRADDGYGGITETWQDVATVMGSGESHCEEQKDYRALRCSGIEPQGCNPLQTRDKTRYALKIR